MQAPLPGQLVRRFSSVELFLNHCLSHTATVSIQVQRRSHFKAKTDTPKLSCTPAEAKPIFDYPKTALHLRKTKVVTSSGTLLNTIKGVRILRIILMIHSIAVRLY